MAYVIATVSLNVDEKFGVRPGDYQENIKHIGVILKKYLFPSQAYCYGKTRKVTIDENACGEDPFGHPFFAFEFEIFEDEKNRACVCEEIKKKFMNMKTRVLFSPCANYVFSPKDMILSDGYYDEDQEIKDPGN
jgi:hypothetical protein